MQSKQLNKIVDQRAGKILTVLLVVTALGACGGGGGSSSKDEEEPQIQAMQPPDGATVDDVRQVFEYRITDAGGSGIDPDTLLVKAGGIDVTAQTRLDDGSLVLSPDAADRWQRGTMDVHVQVSDHAGNTGKADFSYTISPGTQAFPRANPSSGDAPLQITLYPDVSTDAVIESYAWDFDNDGVFDVSEAVGRTQQRRFDTPGQYIVTLKVTDSAGVEATGTVTIEVGNAPPEVTAEAMPSNGALPLTVNFHVQASDNEGIAEYAWDFDGDGVTDYQHPTTGSTQHTYTEAGNFKPVLTVTDTAGTITRLQVPTIDVRVGPAGSPSLSVSAVPAKGKAPLRVVFQARASDPDGDTVTEWRWDFDGDGVDDQTDSQTASNSFQASHEYSRPGGYFARVRAVMSDGSIAEDFVLVEVQQEISMQLSTDTIDPSQGETTTITTTLAGDTAISLHIENSAGRIVRSLVTHEERASGQYQDEWDGTDDHGQVVPGGEYRVILLHEVDGQQRRFDLGLSTGGQQSNPVGTYPSRFAPFSGDPLEISYSLNRASEVTAFLGYLGAGTRRIFTFYHRRPLGRGSHQIIWNGENEDGVMIDPPQGSSGFLIGLFAYTLPDNAIMVNNRVSLTDLKAAPPIMVPDSVTADGSPRLATIQFNLDRPARVIHTINNAENGEIVYRRIYNRLESGSPQIYWDGKNNQGENVAPGYYRHGVTAVDDQGNKSMMLYTMQQLFY